jgi:hypothetical protein
MDISSQTIVSCEHEYAQNYVINFASDIRQVGGVLQVLLFPQLIKIDHHNMAELLLKVALITINLTR